jgi:nucleotide-binding universal stress UspA family protein
MVKAVNARSSGGGTAAAPTWGRVVVGIDPSTASEQAIRWATSEAAVRRASVQIVSVAAGGVARDVDRHVSRDALLEQAATSDLVIVGASTPGAATRWLRTCVPYGGSRRSACPVIVVRGAAPQPLRRIVVGIDGSSASGAVADWAIDEAGRHGADLIVVHAWEPRRGPGRPLRDTELARADSRSIVDLAVRHCHERSGRRARGELIEGAPADVLCAASRHADLIVVGSRGRSGFATLLFGSAAGLVVDRARCPVAVIPPGLRSVRLEPVVLPDTADLDDRVRVSRP